MNLSKQDKRALTVLAIFLVGSVLYFFGDSIVSTLRADSPDYRAAKSRFEPIYSQMNNYFNWSHEIDAAQKRLHVKVNSASPDQQKDEFLKQVEDEGLKRKVQITAHRWVRVTRSAKTGGVEKRAFQIDCTANFPNLIEFVKGIEQLTVPVVVDDISLSRITGGKQGGEKQDLKATLQMHIYIFPEGAFNGAAKS